jgi:serine/threonine protein kinase
MMNNIKRITCINGEYEINLDEELGKGQYGSVYSGKKCDGSSEKFAIKLVEKKNIAPKFEELIRRELENLRKLDHENVLKIQDTCDDGKYHYFVLEKCVKDFSKVLKDIKYDQVGLNNGKFDASFKNNMLKYTFQLIDGMNELYKKQIIHRDIKPANLMLSEKGNLKIADFGFSRVIDKKDKMDHPDKYTKVGTPLYAPYEILSGKDFSSKCDVFSCGVVIYEFFFDSHPYVQPNEKTRTKLVQNMERGYVSY